MTEPTPTAEIDAPVRACLSTLTNGPKWYVCTREKAYHAGDHQWVLAGPDEPDTRVTSPGVGA